MRTTKTEEDERGGRKPTPVLYHGGKFDRLSASVDFFKSTQT